ncbi:hypothetical protein BDV32DRAFT_155986 [Aspergillus pseudonomiae]|nr:hypothetical protein BDV32DRAFT_155986 [Aspergillus pseudonomiae]
MRLVAFLIYVGIAAAAICFTTEPRTTRWCPATDCDKVGSAGGHTRIDCIWNQGGPTGQGKRLWGYNKAQKSFIPVARLRNCHTDITSIPKCVVRPETPGLGLTGPPSADCTVVGQGTAQPRTCPSKSCDPSGSAISTAFNPVKRQINCVWDNGAKVPGGGENKQWGYNEAQKNFIWAGRLQCNLGGIPKCVVGP